jgi:SAM-dependent methyltransferase
MRQARGDYDRWLHGDGIDIGCGPDPLPVPEGSTVRGWDLPDGDAQFMLSVPDGTYDFVYSSHCLEHMRDVRQALQNWVRILKPGGFLYFVIPDYELYEKMCWPSRFNSDHKASFSFNIERERVRRGNHYHIGKNLIPLLQQLGTTIVFTAIEDHGFNYNFAIVDQTMADALSQICIVAQKNV